MPCRPYPPVLQEDAAAHWSIHADLPDALLLRAIASDDRTHAYLLGSCGVLQGSSRLVALNVSSTQGARNDKLFDCFEDDTKTPRQE